jgi:hypothetical protein
MCFNELCHFLAFLETHGTFENFRGDILASGVLVGTRLATCLETGFHFQRVSRNRDATLLLD